MLKVLLQDIYVKAKPIRKCILKFAIDCQSQGAVATK